MQAPIPAKLQMERNEDEIRRLKDELKKNAESLKAQQERISNAQREHPSKTDETAASMSSGKMYKPTSVNVSELIYTRTSAHVSELVKSSLHEEGELRSVRLEEKEYAKLQHKDVVDKSLEKEELPTIGNQDSDSKSIGVHVGYILPLNLITYLILEVGYT